MKRYLTLLTATFVLLLFGTSLVWASIALPAILTIDPIPPFAGKDKSPFNPGPHFGSKDQGLVISEWYLCKARCNRNYMNTPVDPAYHRIEVWLACIEDCDSRFGSSPQR